MGTFCVFLLASLVIALASDRARRVKRDWLHYLGAGIIVAEAVEFFRPFGYLAVRWWQAVYFQLMP
jgi:hypothetical protein